MVVPPHTLPSGFLIDLLYSGSNWTPPLAWKDHPVIIQDPFIPTIVRLPFYYLKFINRIERSAC